MTVSQQIANNGPPEDEIVVIERFKQALRQAMVANRLSERGLARKLGITIGTTQKYFRGRIHPMRIATEVNRKLALELGLTLDSLIHYYETGEYEGWAGFEEVVSWVQTQAGIEHVTPLLEAMTAMSARIGQSGVPCGDRGALVAAERYEWPLQELRDVGISDALRERMGLGDEVMERLATSGEFNDELVEAFSVAVNLEEEAVRAAFTRRKPVAS